ncbi:MAG: hypothetical protein JL50_18260 [Peptococcaceae bacterium BICA1-7]|nr:MAG: hypothetical protein JL50_18260 [Peptococcaceae bacterium BICA1-7]HBV96352.1 hypothetical protein [Desulfotomaculum sp.]
MNKSKRRELSLDLTLEAAFLPVAAAATEQTALAFGLEKKEALQLTLAVEEVLNHLVEVGSSGEHVSLKLADGLYYMEASIDFPLKELNLRAFNLTSGVSLEDESQLSEMGLLIASRMVDRLQLSLKNNVMRLGLYKEKYYPEAGGLKDIPAEDTDQPAILTPGPEDLKLFCRGVTATQPGYYYPSFFSRPGKFVDMVKSGDYSALLAYNGKKQVLGGIAWRQEYEKTIECFGPYLFRDSKEVAGALLDGFLEQVGRTRAPGVLSRWLAPGTAIEKHFESLGAADFYSSGAGPVQRAAHYRQLCEDTGSRVWAHTDLAGFLKEEYRRLFLPREVREVKDMGEHTGAYSVFSCQFDQEEVTLIPLAAGADAGVNLARHLTLFAGEGIKNIYFELDLGEEWHALLTPVLVRNGFRPCYILPHAGKGDLVLFQCRAGEKK